MDWTGLRGSGSTGRIRGRDVRAAAGRPALPEGTVSPLSPIRRTIAERMLTASRSTAPVTLTTTADATNLVNLRDQLKRASAGAGVPSYTDFLVKLAAALGRHPALNAGWAGDGIITDQWAGANRDLANGLLSFATRWDVLTPA